MDDSFIPKAIDRIEALPTLPAVLSRILTTVADPDASALDLARHIAVDQTLTATLLRIVNSAYYSFEREIIKIPDAIVILGFTEVRNLALAAKTFEVFPNTLSAYDRTQLWRHSVATAIASDRCARAGGLLNRDAYFVAGLLHDIGKVVFDVLHPERYRLAALRAHEQGTRIFESERQVFGYDHTTLGAALSNHWHLPAFIATALEDHHAAEKDPTLSDSARVVAVANCIVYEAGLGEASSGVAPPRPLEAAQSLSISDEHLRAIEQELHHAVPRIEGFVDAIPDD